MILQINSQPSFAVNVPIMITPNLHHDPSLLIDVKDFMPVVVSSTDVLIARIHKILVHRRFLKLVIDRNHKTLLLLLSG